jgi:hypothetical protein
MQACAHMHTPVYASYRDNQLHWMAPYKQKTFHLFYLTCAFPSVGLQQEKKNYFKILSHSTLISVTITIRKNVV